MPHRAVVHHLDEVAPAPVGNRQHNAASVPALGLHILDDDLVALSELGGRTTRLLLQLDLGVPVGAQLLRGGGLQRRGIDFPWQGSVTQNTPEHELGRCYATPGGQRCVSLGQERPVESHWVPGMGNDQPLGLANSGFGMAIGRWMMRGGDLMDNSGGPLSDRSRSGAPNVANQAENIGMTASADVLVTFLMSK